jgi:RNA polymerase sigma-70 factor (ECF subfamily)
MSAGEKDSSLVRPNPRGASAFDNMSVMARPPSEPSRPAGKTARDALLSLSPADLARLERIARARAAGLMDVEWSDLLHEALARILAGTRVWPANVPFMAFVAQTIRSLTSEAWRQQLTRPIVSVASSEDVSGLPVDIADESFESEAAVAARQALDTLLAAVQGDAHVLHLVSGFELGETSIETIARTGLTPHQYDAARKRFRRVVDRLFGIQGRL